MYHMHYNELISTIMKKSDETTNFFFKKKTIYCYAKAAFDNL